MSLAKLRGKVVLVNFWATWCEPCVAEMPALQRLRDRLVPGLEVLGVNFREGPARIKPFIEKSGISFPIVRDTDGAVTKAWGVRMYPTSYLVDRAGGVNPSYRRRRMDKRGTGQQIEKLLGSAPSPRRGCTPLARAATLPEKCMQRRTLLQALPAAALVSAAQFATRAGTDGRLARLRNVHRLEVTPTPGAVLAWVPLPLSRRPTGSRRSPTPSAATPRRAGSSLIPSIAGMVVATFKPGEPHRSSR